MCRPDKQDLMEIADKYNLFQIGSAASLKLNLSLYSAA